jgi:hypothetical protein
MPAARFWVTPVAGRDLTRAEWGQYLGERPWRATCTDLE